MSETKTTLTWLLKDEVTAHAEKMKSSLDKAGVSAEKGGGLMGKLSSATGGLVNPFSLAAGAVGILTVGIGTALSAAKDHEVVLARLDQTLKENVKGYNGNRAAIDAYIQKQTDLGFTVDATTASLAQLVTSTGDVGKAQQLLSAAENLARLRGIDLATATDAMTRANIGQTRALKALGIDIHPVTTAMDALHASHKRLTPAMIAQAKASDKQATELGILQAVQKVAGGQADAYGKTMAGSMDKMNAKFGDAMAKIGEGLMPVLAKLAGFFADVIIPGIQAVIGVISTFIGWIASAINWLGDFNKATPAVAGAAAAWQSTGGGRFAGQHRAAGGPVEAGGVYTIGEHGPETLVMGSRGGTVVPHGGMTAVSGVRLVGISEQQILDMVDRGLYFRLQRASPLLGRA